MPPTNSNVCGPDDTVACVDEEMNASRFQFRTKSLLVAVGGVCVLLGWLTSRIMKAQRQHEIVKRLRSGGGFVIYDYQFRPPDNYDIDAPARGIGMFVEFCKYEDITAPVAAVLIDARAVSKVDLILLRKLHRVEMVSLNATNLDFKELLDTLKELPRLRTLKLYGVNLSSAQRDQLHSLLPDCDIDDNAEQLKWRPKVRWNPKTSTREGRN